MNARERLLSALNRQIPDRLPVTHHFVMPYFLEKYMQGMSVDQYFDHMKLDPILWTISHMPDYEKGEFYDPTQKAIGFLESKRVSSEDWRLEPGNCRANHRSVFVAERTSYEKASVCRISYALGSGVESTIPAVSQTSR